MNVRPGLAPTLIVALSASSAVAAPIAIDNFSDIQTVSVAAGPAGTMGSGGISAPGAIKEARYISVTRNVESAFVTSPIRVDQAPNENMLALASSPGMSYDVTVIWDGNTNDTVDPDATTVDLTSGGSNQIVLLQYSTDVEGAEVDLTIYDSDSEDTITAMLDKTDGALMNLAIPFGDFSGIDFSQVVAAKLDVRGAVNLDMRLDLVETDIPTPGAWALGMVAGAICLRRRRA